MQANKTYSEENNSEFQNTSGDKEYYSKSDISEKTNHTLFGLKTRVGKYECVYSPKISNQIVTSILSDCLSRKSVTTLPDDSKQLQTITGRHPIEIVSYSFLSDKGNQITQEAVVRKSQRGGLLSKFNKNYYLGSPQSFPETTRMWLEFAVLNHLRQSGVWVVEPLFAAAHTPLAGFYKGYIATVRLAGSKNFLDLLLDQRTSLPLATVCEYAFLAGREARKAVEAGVIHADLHLGNVMVSSHGIHLIDFDNAKWNKTSSDKACIDKGNNQLLVRWTRGVQKRIIQTDLRNALIKSFEAGLR